MPSKQLAPKLDLDFETKACLCGGMNAERSILVSTLN